LVGSEVLDLRGRPISDSDPTKPIRTSTESPTGSRRRIVLLVVAGLVVIALVATVVVVVVRLANPQSEGYETSAAHLLNWGEPNMVEEFDEPLGPQWAVYDGEGHVGNGVRSPGAVRLADGLLTITGDEQGTTGGLAWYPGQKYGRWEGRVRAPVSDETYNALLLLWPDAEGWPENGEVDFMEMLDPQRQSTEMFLHYGPDNSTVQGEVLADGTHWHNWAVEWTPDHIVAYLDGREWFRTDERETFPPGPMHLAIQLDWFPEQGDRNDVQESQMIVDWVKQYPLGQS
jgi:licheninase